MVMLACIPYLAEQQCDSVALVSDSHACLLCLSSQGYMARLPGHRDTVQAKLC